jgi:hypothetical protein
MLETAHVEATVTTAKLSLAREFYEGLLGLSPAGAHKPDVDVIYDFGGGTRAAWWWSRASSRRHIAPQPGLKTEDGVAMVGGRHFAWFRDPDNNVLAVHD